MKELIIEDRKLKGIIVEKNQDGSQPKRKVLVLADYACATGFANVAGNVMQQINSTGLYDITVIGINYDPGQDYDADFFPGKIYPAITVADMNQADVYGRQRFLNELGKGIYDLVYIIQDTFIVQTFIDKVIETRDAMDKKFSIIFYYPFDAAPKAEWVEECVAKVDFPVPYTNYADKLTKDIAPDLKTEVIYHGTNLKDFFYIENREEVANFRKKYFNEAADDCFLITNINRNQPRKDVFRSFMILNELRKRGRKNTKLYLHMAHNDSGGNILVMADYFGFKIVEDYILPSPKIFQVNKGLPFEVVNYIYNASDAVLSTTLGEGWGLSLTEAMTTRVPVVAPNNTSVQEILADGRGSLVPSGNTPSMWFNLGGMDNERMRPIMDVEKAADALEEIMDGKLPDIDAAEKWAKKYNWDNIGKQWIDVFERAYQHSQTLEPGVKMPEMSRQQRRAMEREAKKLQKKKVSI